MEKKRNMSISKDNKNFSLLPDHANVHPGFQKIIESGFSSDPITSQAKPDPGPDLLFFTPDPETDKPDMDHGKNSGSHWIRIQIQYPANHFISDSLISKPNLVFKLKLWISFLKDHTEMII